jgi:hypothetical protein
MERAPQLLALSGSEGRVTGIRQAENRSVERRNIPGVLKNTRRERLKIGRGAGQDTRCKQRNFTPANLRIGRDSIKALPISQKRRSEVRPRWKG